MGWQGYEYGLYESDQSGANLVTDPPPWKGQLA